MHLAWISFARFVAKDQGKEPSMRTRRLLGPILVFVITFFFVTGTAYAEREISVEFENPPLSIPAGSVLKLKMVLQNVGTETVCFYHAAIGVVANPSVSFSNLCIIGPLVHNFGHQICLTSGQVYTIDDFVIGPVPSVFDGKFVGVGVCIVGEESDWHCGGFTIAVEP